MKFTPTLNFKENVAKFDQILKKFNQIHSLTNYKNLDLIVKDSLDGLQILEKIPKIAIDVGSGAGFPAIFLAMALGETTWHLFEPNVKKAAFLTYVKVNLTLKNVIIHQDKIQNAQKFRADLITSRALMKTKDLIEICAGFYDENSSFLLYKGTNYKEEISGFDAKIFSYGVRNYILISGIK